jgi:hypothetical protein
MHKKKGGKRQIRMNGYNPIRVGSHFSSGLPPACRASGKTDLQGGIPGRTRLRLIVEGEGSQAGRGAKPCRSGVRFFS